ncbi:GGDEF domain-containing protein [Achromobacter piechaudii]|uniref:Diguanylate cyclase (GGDEF) domain protein n=1 Tax=Achromobacter piechaudii ATCC 43553 TaxID=742159 RepID=D4XHF4_9BURK|nr:GGDEF domain-containing protein [Achromobacter piechaudii]EFF73715.1 diguanylate cyclase (GGDEF) domain protein [Achromobacter piechaudii ATCC 43553]
MEALSRAVAGALSPSTPDDVSVAVLFIDLDHLKEVNDAFGHAAGDALLRNFSIRLTESLGPAFFAARVGGDEFVLLLRNTTTSAAEACALAVLNALAMPFEIGGRAISLSASIGIALMGEDPETAETLLSQADTAMYAAKSAGGLRVRTYDVILDRGVRNRVALRSDLVLRPHQGVQHEQHRAAYRLGPQWQSGLSIHLRSRFPPSAWPRGPSIAREKTGHRMPSALIGKCQRHAGGQWRCRTIL